MQKLFSFRFWNSIARLILRNREVILGLILIITIAFTTQWKHMQFTHTEANLLPDDHPINEEYNQFLDKFGEEGNLIILGVENKNLETVSSKMKGVNPKYVPREWMLIKAYRDATDLSDFNEIHTLQQLFDNNPYAEQSPDMEAKYYKKKDQDLRNLGGYSKMSCSS